MHTVPYINFGNSITSHFKVCCVVQKIICLEVWGESVEMLENKFAGMKPI